jgi:hypothetical protein
LAGPSFIGSSDSDGKEMGRTAPSKLEESVVLDRLLAIQVQWQKTREFTRAKGRGKFSPIALEGIPLGILNRNMS